MLIGQRPYLSGNLQGSTIFFVSASGVVLAVLAVFWLAKQRSLQVKDQKIQAGFTLLELLVVIAILGALLGLVLAGVQRARAASARLQCASRLKQIVLSAHLYHDGQGRLPPGCTFEKGLHRQPHMSWLTRLLPYLEQSALWEQALGAYSQAAFFENGPHLAILGRPMAIFACPSDSRCQAAHDFGAFQVAFTSFLGVEGTDLWKKDGTLYLDSRHRLADISDGASCTLLVGERPPSSDSRLGWWYAGWGQEKTGSAEMVLGVSERRIHPRYSSCSPGPYEFRPEYADDPCSAFHFWSLHSGGAHFAFADGAVRFLS